ncbi:MAG: DUF2892 domain-containing protein, partial [Campylobacterales bacterium]|nr:DUF2892 domain-containing protein [Campylobacterales bacterium]
MALKIPNSCNMTKADAYIRLVLSVLLAIFAVASNCYLLIVVSMTLGYTGITRHCFLYEMFKINEKISFKNYYTAQLPKYNPSSVFIFNKKGEIFFRNESAKKYFDNIKNYTDLNRDDLKEIIDNQSVETHYFDNNGFHYQL